MDANTGMDFFKIATPIGMMCWLVYYLVSRTIPGLVDKFTSEMAGARSAFTTEIKDGRELFAKELQATREHCSEELDRLAPRAPKPTA